jgi:hypothetical protein
LSGQTLAANNLTPLNRALQRLVSSNTANGVQLTTCNDADKERLRQRFAYLALVFSMGKGNQVSWFSNADECLWTGVGCNSSKRIISLQLDSRTLGGSLPSDIGLWTNLARFDVYANTIAGSLPSSIGRWSSLNYFSVGDNRMIGTVPVAVSNWTSIETAYFHFNAFNGTMPFVGNNFCPKFVSGDMVADCAPPAEIICDCCLFCCDNSRICSFL